MIKSEITRIYTDSRGDYDKVDILTTYRKPACPTSTIHEPTKSPASTSRTALLSLILLLSLVFAIYFYPKEPTLHFSTTSQTHQSLFLFEQYLQSNTKTNSSYSGFLSQLEAEDYQRTQQLGQTILQSMVCRWEDSKIKCSVELEGTQ